MLRWRWVSLEVIKGCWCWTEFMSRGAFIVLNVAHLTNQSIHADASCKLLRRGHSASGNPLRTQQIDLRAMNLPVRSTACWRECSTATFPRLESLHLMYAIFPFTEIFSSQKDIFQFDNQVQDAWGVPWEELLGLRRAGGVSRSPGKEEKASV